MADLSMEAALGRTVCGVDEVGRGPMAGPVTAAAVIIPDPALLEGPLKGVRDSKRMSARAREAMAAAVLEHCHVSIAEASVAEIDGTNILRATFLAMERAVAGLPVAPAHALVDGNRLPKGLPCPATAVVRGDSLSASIAAASVVAKVHRDRLMARLDLDHPGYGWARNAGYGTAEHMAALRSLGHTAHHRTSFAGVLG